MVAIRTEAPGRGRIGRERLVELQTRRSRPAWGGRSGRPRSAGSSPPNRPGRRRRLPGAPDSASGSAGSGRTAGRKGRRPRSRSWGRSGRADRRPPGIRRFLPSARTGVASGAGSSIERNSPDPTRTRTRLAPGSGTITVAPSSLEALRRRAVGEPEDTGPGQRLLDEAAGPERFEADRDVPTVGGQSRSGRRRSSNSDERDGPGRAQDGPPSDLARGRVDSPERGPRPSACCWVRTSRRSNAWGAARAGPASPRVQASRARPRSRSSSNRPVRDEASRSRARSWPWGTRAFGLGARGDPGDRGERGLGVVERRSRRRPARPGRCTTRSPAPTSPGSTRVQPPTGISWACRSLTSRPRRSRRPASVPGRSPGSRAGQRTGRPGRADRRPTRPRGPDIRRPRRPEGRGSGRTGNPRPRAGRDAGPSRRRPASWPASGRAGASPGGRPRRGRAGGVDRRGVGWKTWLPRISGGSATGPPVSCRQIKAPVRPLTRISSSIGRRRPGPRGIARDRQRRERAGEADRDLPSRGPVAASSPKASHRPGRRPRPVAGSRASARFEPEDQARRRSQRLPVEARSRRAGPRGRSVTAFLDLLVRQDQSRGHFLVGGQVGIAADQDVPGRVGVAGLVGLEGGVHRGQGLGPVLALADRGPGLRRASRGSSTARSASRPPARRRGRGARRPTRPRARVLGSARSAARSARPSAVLRRSSARSTLESRYSSSWPTSSTIARASVRADAPRGPDLPVCWRTRARARRTFALPARRSSGWRPGSGRTP